MQSEKISQSKDRYFRRDRLRINWEYDLTWERAMPDLFSFVFFFFWASPSGNTNLQGVSKRWKTWCLMLRVNTHPSWTPTPHTGKPSPWGTDSPLCPLSKEGLRTGNSHTESNTGLSHNFPLDHTPLLVRPHVHSSRGHLRWPHNSLRPHSRPWSSPTQSREPSPPPGPDLSLISGG